MVDFVKYILLSLLILFSSCKRNQLSKVENSVLKIKQASVPILIDGNIENAWQAADWIPIDQKWLGPAYTPEDFTGRYKCLWDKDFVYLLAEIKDDVLLDIHEDPLDHYWDDDCLEIFIDENRSKGNHQYNHSAFAYHVALNMYVTDIGTDEKPRKYDHLNCARKSSTKNNITIWETRIRVYSDQYIDDGENTPLVLSAGKVMGLAVAYCDNDNSDERENFIGSVPVAGEDKNRGWIDAGVFGEVILVK